ncbi:NADH-ubiquinone oxidoreductase 40 kDa subunit mitochondrial [Fusarium albosuccineum]|uniref:NADH-ubiquinone oxidoreductase 40 kDa subunit mitochondrial n=1 Tax=Fusarium albosuccineum TaxID=1237068 RepID=A0A8H4L930_9HYPO|nr:NADH-ubiquinone oxidoreductase 40 kDa subunit mitochondrial [Fusarium albosuccineum]
MASPLLAARSARNVAFNVAGKRFLSDISITRTGKPIIRVEGGRSSLGGHTVTVFGATGQLGRYIVNRLARQGCTVVVPFREEMTKRHLKVTGDLGRVVFVEHDLRNTPSIEASVRHSDAVFNLIGRDYPTKNFSLEDVHIEGTERIVEAVAKYDVDRYIHISSHSANSKSVSEFYRTKGRAEEIARELFPETTIVRPAPIFGFEDNLLLKLAGVTNLFTSNNMQEKFYPVHSIDLGAALEKIFYDDTTAGQTFELYGPKQYSMRQIANMVDKEIYKQRRHINVPKAILKPAAEILNKVLWWHTLSADEVEREYLDQVIDPEAKTFKDLGIEPSDIANFTYHYLQGFRSQNFYDLPPATDKEKREEKKYIHVLDEFVLTLVFPYRSLSSHALAALAEFHAEKDAHRKTFEQLKTGAAPRAGAGAGVVEPGDEDDTEEDPDQAQLSMAAFTEDWNESQFWVRSGGGDGFAIGFWGVLPLGIHYVLARGIQLLAQQNKDKLHDLELGDDQRANMGLALLLVPRRHSVYPGRPAPRRRIGQYNDWRLIDAECLCRTQESSGKRQIALRVVRNTAGLILQGQDMVADSPKLVLFEHDHRFNVFPEFVFYDFQRPLQIPGELKGSLDSIIIDPPFFSNDCQTKFALTARWLLKTASPRVIVCTGERMAPLVDKLYRSLKVYSTTFEPAHSGLSNHYYCYANFETNAAEEQDSRNQDNNVGVQPVEFY